MKKTILMVAAATLTLASCSSDEDINVYTGNAIDFRAAMALNSRSTVIDNGNLGNITVSAYKDADPYFKAVEFKKTDASYNSDTKYYWPVDGTLTFWAFKTGQEGATVDYDGITYTNYSVEKEIANQIDLVAATTTGTKADNEANGADLPFKHLLSQIQVNAKCTSADFTVKVKRVEIARVQGTATGTYTATTNADGEREGKAEWTGHSGAKLSYATTAYETGVALGETAVPVMGTEGNAILMPQDITSWVANPERAEGWTDNGGAYIALYVQIKNKVDGSEGKVQMYPATTDADGYGWVAVPVTLPEGTTGWEPGKKYTYTLDFATGAGYVKPGPNPGPDPDPEDPGDPVLGDPIKFTVTVENWDNNNVPVDSKL